MRMTNPRKVIPARARQLGAYRATYAAERDQPERVLTVTLHEDATGPRGPRRFLSLARMASESEPSEHAVFTYSGGRLYEAGADYRASLDTARAEAVRVEELA